LVNVIRHYARVDGVRVPIATESTAKVKLAGLSYLDVHYDYETINGRPVSMAGRPISPVPMREDPLCRDAAPMNACRDPGWIRIPDNGSRYASQNSLSTCDS